MENYTIRTKAYLKEKICAVLIDLGIFYGLVGIYIFLVGQDFSTGDGSWHFKVFGSWTLPIFGLWFMYFVVSEAMLSTTLGQSLFGLSVLKLNGNKISLRDAFLRRLCDPLDLYVGGIPALILVLKTPHHQRLGDIIANTVVVKRKELENSKYN